MIKSLIGIVDIVFIGLMWIIGGLLFLLRVAILLILTVLILTLFSLLKLVSWGIRK